MKLPLIGLGTWDLRGNECTEIVQTALDVGYRHIDTAHIYQNHVAIGKAIATFNRSQLFITSKLDPETQIDRANVAHSVNQACDLALKELNTPYLDLYLIHWPDRSLPLAQMYQAMNHLVEQGKVKRAGVSNFTIHHLEDLRKAGPTPWANQVEFHPYLYQKELLEYCRKHDIELIAYRPFGKGKLLPHEPILKTIGSAHGMSPAQVVLRWLIQKRIPAIPKASSKKHLQENLAAFDFVLSESEMAQLDQLNRGTRFCMPDEPEFLY